MNAFSKSFQLFSIAAVASTLIVSSACARIAPDLELRNLKPTAPIATFPGLQQDIYGKGAPVSRKEGGTNGKRYAASETKFAVAGTQEAGAAETKYAVDVEVHEAGSANAQYAAATVSDAGTGVIECANTVDTMVQYTDASQAYI